MFSKGTGYHVDSPDWRDFKFDDLSLGGMSTKTKTSMKENVPDVLDQHRSNACVLKAVKTQIGTRCISIGEDHSPISSRYMWYNTRASVGNQRKNVGCQPRVAMKIFRRLGGSLESVCPFSRLTPIHYLRPSWESFAEGYQNKGRDYHRIDRDRVNAIRSAIESKIPIIVGLAIGKEFSKTRSNAIIEQTENPTGRHMVCIVGYDLDSFEIVNSWGKRWGQGGFSRISNEYVRSEDASDFYAIL